MPDEINRIGFVERNGNMIEMANIAAVALIASAFVTMMLAAIVIQRREQERNMVLRPVRIDTKARQHRD